MSLLQVSICKVASHTQLRMCVSSDRFIITDLSTVDRQRTPWVVVNMHRPIYTSSTAGVSPPSVLRVAEDLQQALEPVFILYQVPI